MRLILAALLLVCSAFPSWAAKAVVEGQGGLKVFSTPTGKRLVGSLPPKAEVEVLEDRGGAVRVRYEDRVGWVKRTRLRLQEDPRPEEAPVAPARAPNAAALPQDAPVSASSGAPAAGAAPSPGLPAPPSNAPVASPVPLADPYAKYGVEPAAPKVDVGPSLFTTISALLLVLALIAGTVYLVRLLSGRKYLGGAKARGIQVLATRPLGPRQALVLVDVGGVPLLLAQCEGMVNLLAEIRDPDALKRLNDIYGFRETPFESELRQRLDLETQEAHPGPAGPRGASEPSPEERLAALRRRPQAGEEL